MSNYLEYHPHLEYKRKLKAILQDYGANKPSYEEVMEESSPPPFPSDLLAKNGYVPSEAMKDRVDITPTDVLVKFLQVKGKIGTLIDRIVEKLEDTVTPAPTIQEYIKAREDVKAGTEKKEEKSWDVIHEFEDYHEDRIEGSTPGEALPIVYQTERELDELSDFMTDHLFPDEPSQDLDYLEDQLDRLEKDEESELNDLIEQDKNGTLDEDRIKEENHILYFLHEKADQAQNALEGIEAQLFDDSAFDRYHGNGAQIADAATQQKILKDEFKKMVQRSFLKDKENAADARRRMERLATPGYKRKLLDEAVKMQKEKLKAKESLEDLFDIIPKEDGDPFNIFLLQLGESIQWIKEESDLLIDDLYKILELDHIQSVDWLDSLEGKDTWRQMDVILNGIQDVVEEEKEINREIDPLYR